MSYREEHYIIVLEKPKSIKKNQAGKALTFNSCILHIPATVYSRLREFFATDCITVYAG